jgi:23S rRNA (guanosine2251-2'-O)-methyltransferase
MSKRKHPHSGEFTSRNPGPGRAPQGGPQGRPPGQAHAPARTRSAGPKAGRYWLFGHHPVEAALRNPNRDVYKLRASPQGIEQLPADLVAGLQSRVSVEMTDSRDLERHVPQGAVHQGLALEVAPLDPADLADSCARIPERPNLVLVLDQVTDPHNVGAILRSAAAFGARAVVTTDRHAPPETGTLAKSASGALDLVPLVRVVNLVQALDHLAELGYWRIGLSDQATSNMDKLDMGPDIVLALGAEGRGLRRLTQEHCDILGRLPTSPAMPSLNVSNAAAVALYELARRGQSVLNSD